MISLSKAKDLAKNFKKKRHQSRCWDDDITPNSKDNHVGVELEFASDLDFDQLCDLFNDTGLHKHVSIAEDGSVGGGVFGAEIRVIAPEKEIKKVVRIVCALIAPFGRVNATCGLHIHLDMRNRDASTSFDKLVAAQPVLFAAAKKERYTNTYCDPVPYDAHFGWQSQHVGSYGGGERSVAVNELAMRRHKTIEVRLFDGTLDAKTINTRIDLLLSIIANDKPLNKCTLPVLKRQLPRPVYRSTVSLIKKLKNERHLQRLENERAA